MMRDLLDGPVGASLTVPCDLSTDAVEAAIQVVARLDRDARRHGVAPTSAQLLRALRTDLHGRYQARNERP